MSYYLQTGQELQQFLQKIKNCHYIALDTEFMREKTYYSRLCLIQIAANNELACIDPLKIDDLNPLMEVIYNKNITKVIHSAYQDLEIFYHLNGKIPTPIFDTQSAASILGMGEHIGYAKLVQHILQIFLEKSQSRTNWLRRPLTQKQLDYAVDDVRYLYKIYPILLKNLQQKNRLNWLAADYSYLTSPKTYQVDTRYCWKKTKNVQTLKPQQLSVLRELSEWRELQAQKSNIPKRWLLSDDVLLKLAKQQPKTLQDLQKIYGISRKELTKYQQAWFKCIKKGQAISPENYPKLIRRRKLTKEEDLILDLLMTAVHYQAAKHHIAPSMIATRKQLEKMLRKGKKTFSNDWRGALMNTLFNNLLTGKKSFVIQAGKVIIKSI